MKHTDHVYKKRSYAWLPTRLVTGEWVWMTPIVTVVDYRPLVYLGMYEEVYHHRYPESMTVDKMELLP